ncbi:hypothetical protein MASR1M29_01490 [Cloacibacterium normanense]
MNSDYKQFQVFNNIETLNTFTNLLSDNKIGFEVENNSKIFDPSFANNDFEKEYIVKIHPNDFEKVYDLEEEIIKNEIQNTPEDYYLFDYNNSELLDIVNKRDEWNAFDYYLAKKILNDRGNLITEEKIIEIKKERIEELKKPTEIKSIWIILLYLITILGIFLPLFIGLSSIIYGYFIRNMKKTLPNGESVYQFSEKDRKHGTVFLFGGIFFFIFWILFFALK